MISAILLLAICGGCGSETSSSSPAAASSLAGADADNNGVRDDIDVYIDSTTADADTKKAFRQYAKAVQSSILDANDASKSITHVTERFRALECLMARTSDFHAAFVELRARILDTNPRSEAYLKVDSQVAAVNIPLFPADQWVNQCTP